MHTGGDANVPEVVDIKEPRHSMRIKFIHLTPQLPEPHTLISHQSISSWLRLDTLMTLRPLKHFCHNSFVDCGSATGLEPELSCSNNTLTASWPTNVTFSGIVQSIPTALYNRLTGRLTLQSKFPILHVVVTNQIPP